MSVTMHIFPKIPDRAYDSESIGDLIRELGSDDGLARQRARANLVDIDGPAVPSLISALSNPSRDIRWEAVKALGEIRDAGAAPALVRALEDERFGVRWLAAEALIALGKEAALAPLLEALSKSADSVWLRRGAHHVLRTFARDGLSQPVQAVLDALEDVEPTVEVPPRARVAAQALASGGI